MEDKAPAEEAVATQNLTLAMRRFIIWGIVVGAASVGISYLAFVIYWTWQEEGWVKDVVKQHFSATVGLPLSAIGAFLLVTVLQISSGKITLEVWGFKLSGASGPVILWVVCFLAIALGIRLLW